MINTSKQGWFGNKIELFDLLNYVFCVTGWRLLDFSKNIKKEVKATPFFTRFLEAQQEQSNQAPATTLKFPSDWEEW